MKQKNAFTFFFYRWRPTAELAERYEAESSADILVLLETTPDLGMLEKGIAREVVNRVQKFCKSAGLKVSDEVTLHCVITPADHSLTAILTKYLK